MFRSSMKIPEVDIHGTLLVPAGVDGAEEASPSVLNLRPAHECVTRRIDVVTVALTRIAAVVTIGARVPDFDARAGDWCAIGRIHHDEAQSQWPPGWPWRQGGGGRRLREHVRCGCEAMIH